MTSLTVDKNFFYQFKYARKLMSPGHRYYTQHICKTQNKHEGKNSRKEGLRSNVHSKNASATINFCGQDKIQPQPAEAKPQPFECSPKTRNSILIVRNRLCYVASYLKHALDNEISKQNESY